MSNLNWISTSSDLYTQARTWAADNWDSPTGKADIGASMRGNSRRVRFTVKVNDRQYGPSCYDFEATIKGGRLIFPDLDEYFGTDN